MISLKEIEKLASLARIEIKDEEKENFQKEIGSILNYIEQIKIATGEKTERQKEAIRNVFREDKNPHKVELFLNDILSEAPMRDGDYFKVKKIIKGHDPA